MCDYKSYIFDYLISGKELNEKSLLELISLIVLSEGLHDYLSRVEVGKLKCYAIYYPSYRNLIIDLENIKFSSFNLLPTFTSNLNKKEFTRFFNFNCLCTILHELQHVKQKRDSIERTYGDSVIQSLINEGIEFGSRLPNNVSFSEKILYNFFYNQVLFERDAEIKSLLNFIDLGNEFSFFSIGDLSFFNEKLLKMCLRYYKKNTSRIISPSEIYYCKRGKIDEYLSFDFDDQQDIINVLSWGLPINSVCYEKLESLNKECTSTINVKKKILSLSL